ncbi:MAG TPA: hypothetical protein VF519_10915 [Mycobacteriales bacterium]|jgi:hypothetical protein
MDTGARRRSIVAAFGYVVYVVAVPTLMLVGVRYDLAWLVGVSAVLGALVIGFAFVAIVFALVTVIGRRRIPYLDRLPAEAYASVVAVPIATTVAATAASVIPAIPRTALGWAYIVALGVLEAMCAFGIALACAYRLTVERGGRHLALYDETAPAADLLYSAQRRWGVLVSDRRWVFARSRRSWLGTFEEAPVRAWPSAWARPRPLRARWLLAWGPLASGLVASALALLALPGPDRGLAVIVGLIVATAVLTIALRVFCLALEEQTEAERLRERVRTLRARLSETAAPAPAASRSRVGRLLAALLDRE